ncbi:SDR family oxidoreductase [Myxococcota bacterium]|nr:SDR family oxidoreductase [Myxococcota bacterium]
MSEEQVVWITGASSGIGAALARAWAKRGAALILSARRVAELEAVKASLGAPERTKLLPLDVADPAALGPAAAEALAWRGQIDVLVNNAGISQRATALDASAESVRRLMEVNFFGAVELTRLVVPSMLTRRSGHVVFTSSVAGYLSTPMRSTYAAAKHAIRAWADALRAELHGTGVDVTTICPGYIATGISALALRGDGSGNGKIEPTDAKGMDVDVAAEKMMRGLSKRAPEIFVGGPEVHAILLKRFAPGIVVRLLHRFSPGDR